ncbi:daunorubicin resistance protein DrrA family ABC transporter ATP-binding protein [Microbacterium barkeri]|uniref:Daunorubicin resistance protein DrrA family ABC transporter ATP-binding protein n=1 Tax=Microbacterium barkeri TaxID=33917 RepID=A0A9W6H1Q9_9MICO|nr:ATP-binding cassette domain-containing protein [Microbacterium barkeri]MDI6942525.1 ATP-binding cassette domain-containing protein [Microbacterium barkeri]MDR6875316.1 ABC-2 type transport system ATP-binding protein [Microbacterium barkeri]GLJ60518.1 daunorubicin resistance protein DrrA family ABC transporter ATP-binding protein [Microbacterium barkeri]
MTAMISATDLRKTYGKKRALDGFTLSVDEGTVCGLLGPNGAGKTTAVRILATLLKADSGNASIAGHDLTTDAGRVRAAIGFTGQFSAVDEILTGRQNLDMFARLYHLDRRQARQRTDELLDRFALHDAADRPAGGYSGGMRRRLDLAVSLILAPRVLFLDEPTTGLDPRTRAEVWTDIRELVSAGTTVLLTTQYLDEADHLADQIAVIDSGTIIARGTPRELKESVGGDRIELALRDEEQTNAAARIVAAATGTDPGIDLHRRRVSAPAPERFHSLSTTMRQLHEAGIDPEDVALRQPTLDDVFIKLTDREEKTA